jgi:hypothetical protein
MDDPSPGRPLTLGVDADLVDAGALFAIIEAGRALIGHGRARSGAGRVLREAIWFLWEQPRLPGPLVASKYPPSYPWSPEARRAYSANHGRRPPGGWSLVIEHMYPRELLVAELLDDAAIATATDVVEVLSARLIAAVVTTNEDRILPPRSRVLRDWSAYAADPWVRYRMSGLPVDQFRALPEVAAAAHGSSGAPPADGAHSPSVRRNNPGRQLYDRFWAELTERIQHEHPQWGRPHPSRNDLRLFSPLPQTRLKCNFSRDGLRVELLLEARERSVNMRRLEILEAHVSELEAALGGAGRLRVEPLDGRTQARIATYRPGGVDEERRWPEFQTWFINTVEALHCALGQIGISRSSW